MASKSTISAYVDDDAGTSIQIQSDGQDYLAIVMTDGRSTVSMKLSSVNAHKIRNVFTFADALRTQLPTS